MADVVTPADLLQPAWAQCSIWHFFIRKNIYFGRGKRKTENKLTLTNPKTKYGLRNPLVPFLDDFISKRMNP